MTYRQTYLSTIEWIVKYCKSKEKEKLPEGFTYTDTQGLKLDYSYKHLESTWAVTQTVLQPNYFLSSFISFFFLNYCLVLCLGDLVTNTWLYTSYFSYQVLLIATCSLMCEENSSQHNNNKNRHQVFIWSKIWHFGMLNIFHIERKFL